MTVSVCVSLCMSLCLYVREHISENPHPIFTIFVRVIYGRGSVIFWRRCDTLYTSGFMDNVILAHKSDVAAQLMEAQSTRSLGLGYKGA